MSKSTGRFNLRTRKSLKNQLECVSCKRNYFPMELSEEDENNEQTENICCDCDGKRQTELQPKRRTISIKVEKTDSNDAQCQKPQPNGSKVYATRKSSSSLNPGSMVQIHSIELLKPTAAITNVTNIPRLTKIKEEKLDIPLKEVMKSGRSNRALRNKTNTMETANDQGTVQQKHQTVITKDDTAESLRQKFPNVNQYEFEYLLFLKAKSD
ncbi:uncharacterized protein LOC129569903 isoform X1 [Sitodiplosis mosellana]|uniref:uncharacterized protein LOC129569903 isoform X1 n=1 Tax=Sitodiplosis mosellana TaxID=263140 RepID=UPI0024438327|nr:uncharacterized protein LOC129569903 isoform X1 [Sitodiplosis mosellana]